LKDPKLIADWLVRHRFLLLLILLLSLIVPSLLVGRLHIDNSVEVWLDRHSQAFRQYEQFLARYGSEEFVIIAAESDNPLSKESLTFQRNLAGKLKQIPQVEKVLDVPEVYDLLYKGKANAIEQANQSILLKNLLLGEDHKTYGILLWLKQLKGPQARREAVSQIQKIVQDHFGADQPYHLAGTPVLNVALDRQSQKASRTFLPIAIGISIIILFLAVRSIGAVAACILSVAVSVFWTMGIMAALGRTLNMITVVLPSLLFIMALSTAIHLATRFQRYSRETAEKENILRRILQELIPPAALSAITTSAGFASLLISDMQPVADFGLLACLGILISLPCNLILVPTLLSLRFKTPSFSPSAPARISPALDKLIDAILRLSRISLIIALGVAVGCAAMFSRLKTESNVIKFFPENSNIVRDYTFVAQHLTGLYSIEMDFQTTSTKEKELQADLFQLAKRIDQRKEVARVNYLGQLTGAWSPNAKTVIDLSKFVKAGRLAEYLSAKYRFQGGEKVHLRLSILVRAMDSSDFYGLLDFIKNQTNQIMPNFVSSQITGVVPLLNAVQQNLIHTQIECFALAAVVVLVLIGLLLHSVRAGLASVLPNVLPVCMVFGLMALIQIPLDPATVMIASVAIGLAVDDTIHFLVCYQRARHTGLDYNQAAKETIVKIGPAMVFTSIVAAAGFSILLLAPFRPIAYFGLLTAVTIVSALAADILLMPGCAKLFRLGGDLTRKNASK